MTKRTEDMSTSELEQAGDTHNGSWHQVPTEYHARQRWEAQRREFRRRTGHDPRPHYARRWPNYDD